MPQSREKLVRRALNKLGVIGAGQAPAAEDAALIDGGVETIMADLATRGIYTWGDPDQIDDDAFEHLATILANAFAEDFGKPSDETKRLMAESRLRQLDITTLSGQPQRVEYI